MIRRFCDNCQEECKEQDFRFDGMIVEIKTISSLVSGSLQQQPRMEKKEIHLCRKCYDKKFKVANK